MKQQNVPHVLALQLASPCGNGRFLLSVPYSSKDLAISTLDRIDLAILDTLQRDGRISNAALAEKVGLSQSACSRRLDLLEKNGTIRGYHAQISSAGLGHPMTAIVHISLSGQFEKTLSEFEAAIKRCPNVLSCHLMTGEYDYILRIAARDLADYERIHKEWLSAMPHVTRINSAFAMREIIDRTAIGLKTELA
ncbi:Lrp/AsnC family transcriptional regulator [Tianweitania sediminis]|uniref:Lrp/AsnC family transcriptional regulator n=1 Tax=Tianweitania sediminis TaxID=1502156 RepID=A0A8J7UJ78_9HYPH|nr:Lrp/AsnC family transcriptional regulator [Tianweitania sediminis]